MESMTLGEIVTVYLKTLAILGGIADAASTVVVVGELVHWWDLL